MVVLTCPPESSVAEALYMARGALLLKFIMGGWGEVQPRGLGSFDDVVHRPCLVKNTLPAGVVVPGVIDHSVGYLVLLPLTFSTTAGTFPPLSPPSPRGLVGGWGLLYHGEGAGVGSVG